MAIDREKEARLWGAWPESRAELAALYQPVVLAIARTMERHLARVATTCFDDLVSMGQVGLLNALDRYRSGGPVRFTSYCGQRIRGAMIDEIRRLDHVPRRERELARQTGTVLPGLMIQAEVPEPCVEWTEEEQQTFRHAPDQFLRYLDHTLRPVAQAVVVEGRPMADLAEEMGCEVKEVEELYERMKRRLLDLFRRRRRAVKRAS
jgi:RNA polymerase sigma factor (sigma-70 family)